MQRVAVREAPQHHVLQRPSLLRRLPRTTPPSGWQGARLRRALVAALVPGCALLSLGRAGLGTAPPRPAFFTWLPCVSGEGACAAASRNAGPLGTAVQGPAMRYIGDPLVRRRRTSSPGSGLSLARDATAAVGSEVVSSWYPQPTSLRARTGAPHTAHGCARGR